MHKNTIRTLLLFAATLFVASATAEQVYTWTDDDGVVHFSQWMPDDTNDVKTLYIAGSSSTAYDPSEDPYSIRNQAVRMGEAWSKLEERKEARRKERQEQAENAARRADYYDPYYTRYPYRNRYYPPYYPPVIRPPIHRPIHPGYQRKVQKYQVAALEQFNARSHIRSPYSAVTGVSQRATIQSFPGMPRPNP